MLDLSDAQHQAVLDVGLTFGQAMSKGHMTDTGPIETIKLRI
jgi:hypothetical protein